MRSILNLFSTTRKGFLISARLIVLLPLALSSPQVLGRSLNFTPSASLSDSKTTLNFESLHMLNLTEGWAYALVDQEWTMYLYTNDGGQTWSEAAAYGSSSATSRPGTWISDPAPEGNVQLGAFSDSLHGWKLDTTERAAGNEDGTLYRTTDGGITWLQVGAVDFGGNGNLPAGYHTGLAFESPTEGWMTLSSINHIGGLAQTVDGGVDWMILGLPDPSGYNLISDACDFTDFRIFAPGSLSVIADCDLDNGTTAVFLYSSYNDGKSWHIAGLTPKSPLQPVWGWPPSPLIAMLSMTSGWTVATSPNSPNVQILYWTSDSGLTWTKSATLPARLMNNDSQTTLFDFVDKQHGWAAPSDNLEYTADGGKSWIALNPVFV